MTPVRVVLFFDPGFASRPLPVAATDDLNIANSVIRSAISAERRRKEPVRVKHLKRIASVLLPASAEATRPRA